MNADPVTTGPLRATDLLAAAARWLLAAVFLYLGTTKALHPEEFLKLVRQYDLTGQPLALNFVAATLPWFEMLCGLLLLSGVAVRGTALLVLAMLVPFTVLILLRAQALGTAGGLPFCAIAFDCGCGTGEVNVCRKLAENAVLAGLAAGLAFSRRQRLCLRFSIVAQPPSG